MPLSCLRMPTGRIVWWPVVSWISAKGEIFASDFAYLVPFSLICIRIVWMIREKKRGAISRAFISKVRKENCEFQFMNICSFTLLFWDQDWYQISNSEEFREDERDNNGRSLFSLVYSGREKTSGFWLWWWWKRQGHFGKKSWEWGRDDLTRRWNIFLHFLEWQIGPCILQG